MPLSLLSFAWSLISAFLFCFLHFLFRLEPFPSFWLNEFFQYLMAHAHFNVGVPLVTMTGKSGHCTRANSRTISFSTQIQLKVELEEVHGPRHAHSGTNLCPSSAQAQHHVSYNNFMKDSKNFKLILLVSAESLWSWTLEHQRRSWNDSISVPCPSHSCPCLLPTQLRQFMNSDLWLTSARP